MLNDEQRRDDVVLPSVHHSSLSILNSQFSSSPPSRSTAPKTSASSTRPSAARKSSAPRAAPSPPRQSDPSRSASPAPPAPPPPDSGRLACDGSPRRRARRSAERPIPRDVLPREL